MNNETRKCAEVFEPVFGPVRFQEFWTAVHQEIFFFMGALDGLLIWKPLQLDNSLDKLVQTFYSRPCLEQSSIMKPDELKKLLVECTDSQDEIAVHQKDYYIIGKIDHVAPDMTAATLAFLPPNILCALKVARGGFYNYAGGKISWTSETLPLASCIVVSVVPHKTSGV